MFTKVLVANRGEIACRVIRTLREMKIASVAVYHAADRAAPHVKLADEAVLLEADVPSAAYLDQQQILSICKASGAQAIHPGYGFLSENAGFAEAVAGAGLTFIGPDPTSMRLMGDKIRSRDFAREQKVPVAPSAMLGDDVQAFIKEAVKVGFPLLIKASAGGGGKGMKIVRRREDLEENVRLASSEAQRYFSDGRVYAERFVERPRHIEVQVVGDGRGNVVHLHERECSVQRRYQKIIEECPAPNLTADLKQRICASAVQLASAAKYKNAGTVEFVLAPDGEFYFLEMNTRLQVEHPVTEMVLGVDLVAEQLRIAAGEPLSFKQKDLQIRGHAIEARICAEEPEHEFRPATGRIGVLRSTPDEKIRFECGISAGQSITPAFDSMLAKLVAYDNTRGEAVARLDAALADLVVLGIATNNNYLRRILQHKEFKAGHLHTGFIAEHAASLQQPALSNDEQGALAMAALLATPENRNTIFDVPAPYAGIGQWRN
jgi:acetyl-CoA carboxylase biotin carboxylase subunit